MKVILENILFTMCTDCGVVKEHRAEVHSSIHFSPISPDRTWINELNDFLKWLKGHNIYPNFNEAYIAYLNRRSETI